MFFFCFLFVSQVDLFFVIFFRLFSIFFLIFSYVCFFCLLSYCSIVAVSLENASIEHRNASSFFLFCFCCIILLLLFAYQTLNWNWSLFSFCYYCFCCCFFYSCSCGCFVKIVSVFRMLNYLMDLFMLPLQFSLLLLLLMACLKFR